MSTKYTLSSGVVVKIGDKTYPVSAKLSISDKSPLHPAVGEVAGKVDGQNFSADFETRGNPLSVASDRIRARVTSLMRARYPKAGDIAVTGRFTWK